MPKPSDKFLQHYQVIDWENYAEGESPVGNQEKQITLKNGDDKVVVTRNEAQRSDEIIEREITLNDKTVLSATNDHFYYLLPWTDSEANEDEATYHYNLGRRNIYMECAGRIYRKSYNV